MPDRFDPIEPLDDDVQRSYLCDPHNARNARNLVADYLRTIGCSAAVVELGRLVTSELAANAVRHAATGFSVRCAVGDRIRIEVADHAPAPSLVPLHPDRVPNGEVGHGLQIIANHARQWGVERDGHGKTIWCEIDAGALRP